MSVRAEVESAILSVLEERVGTLADEWLDRADVTPKVREFLRLRVKDVPGLDLASIARGIAAAIPVDAHRLGCPLRGTGCGCACTGQCLEWGDELASCTCPVGFGAVRDANCPRHNPRPRHTISGAS